MVWLPASQIEKNRLTEDLVPNLAIVTAYNDMLSAHQPYEGYPEFAGSLLSLALLPRWQVSARHV